MSENHFFRRARVLLLACCGVLLSACSFSFTTSHISSLKLSSNSDGSTEASVFGAHDTIYARGTASNVSGKITLTWHLVGEKVDGEPENFGIDALNKAFDLDSDGSTTYNLSAPDNGWPPGKYRIELHMAVEGGEEKDLKTAGFTVNPA